MTAHDIIIAPVITEKSNMDMAEGKYTFRVAKNASKTEVKKAVEADHATLATTATNSLAVNNKVVDNSTNTSGVLWTADKIISNTTSQIQNEGVNTYSGTSVPADTLGKNGDIYVLIGS